MYVTRKISDFRTQPELLEIPVAGPLSGILVIQDEEAEAAATCCFGFCKNTNIKELPFPQNKTITISYTTGSAESSSTSTDYVMLIPVPNRPLSDNVYYVIQAKGKRQGEAHTSSTEEDMKTCCFCRCIKDVKSKPLEPSNNLQQFELFKHPACSSFYGFECKSIAQDAFPPYFLRNKGWRVDARTPKDFTLGEALGTDEHLRKQLPEFDKFSIKSNCSETVQVGKWYIPFMFVKESWANLKDQMKKSMYYEMVLEQRWEKVFESENDGGRGKSMKVDIEVETEVVELGGGGRAVGNAVDGWMWYKGGDGVAELGRGVGLRIGIVERMKWEEKGGGWDGSNGKVVVVDAVEDYGWKRFACYVLVERFVLKRMDGTLVMKFDFYHTHQTKCKWE